MTGKRIIVMVGPSGSGKTSIGRVLTQKGIPRLVTTTTRDPRPGEKNGIDYYFREFSELDIDDFVEQTIYNGNRYGLTKAEIEGKLEKHDVVHVSLDKNGAKAICEIYPDEAYIVFVSISEDEMIRRMQIRGDSEEEIQQRIAYSRETDELTPPEFTDLSIINKDIEKTADKILDHVMNKNEI